MTRHEYEFELEEFCDGRFFATVWIEYEADPGEPMIRYYPDGSGHPGSPATVCPIKARVTSLSGANWDKTRGDLERFLGTHMQALDDLALDAACDLVEEGGWLAVALFDRLEALSEDTRY